MLYYLFQYLDQLNFPGAGVFQYITFRSSLAFIFALLLAIIYGKRIINYLSAKQIGETVRELGLEGQNQKAGTPTMGARMHVSRPTCFDGKFGIGVNMDNDVQDKDVVP